MLIKLIEHLHKGGNLRIPHKGTVIFNNDPRKLGRVKVVIDDLLDGDSVNSPYVYPKSNSMLGGGTNISSFAVPEIGSELIVEFESDDIYFPFYTGYWQSDMTHQRLFDEQYPQTYGSMDSIGNFIKIDKSDGSVLVQHTSGSKVILAKDGTVKINPSKNIEIATKDGGTKIVVDAPNDKIELTAGEDLNITTKGITTVFKERIETGGKETKTLDSQNTTVIAGNKLNIGGSSSEGVVSNKMVTIGGDKNTVIGGVEEKAIGTGSTTTVVIGDYTIETKMGGISLLSPLARIDINADGSAELANTIGGSFKINAIGQVQVKGATDELIDLVFQIATTLSTTTAPGFNGPISTVGNFALLALRLLALKAV